MKPKLFLIILFFGLLTTAFSKEISSDETQKVITNFLKTHNKTDFKTEEFIPIIQNNNCLAVIYQLSPLGYIVVATNSDLPPILAYSFETNFGEISFLNPMYSMLFYDLTSYNTYISENSSSTFVANNRARWEALFASNSERKDVFEQWPSLGDGWLKTNWTQSEPYSNFCPLDPVTSSRSYTGCPATAMSQILNFHKSINGTRFNNSDDYYHNYAGRQFQIDDDYDLHGFPSFIDLNYYLDTLQAHWNNNVNLTDNDKAALNFGCGVAAKQVFTSEGSGTFSVSQAHDAYIRFGCNSALLIEPEDTMIHPLMIDNIKDTLPVHLAIVDASWSSGHNVVVDGYNTDDYFHVNFGWGGSYNGWYLLPQELPMSLTSFEGAIINIMKPANVSVDENIAINSNINVFPNPFIDNLTINFYASKLGLATLKISNLEGRLCLQKSFYITNTGMQKIMLTDVPVCNGLHYYQISTPDKLINGKIIKID